MDWSWAVDGVTEEVPRTTGPECINYMTNRRRWIEAVLFTTFFILVILWAVKRLESIALPPINEINRPHSAARLMLLIAMTFTFGVEMGFKFAGKSVIFVLNPCHIQTVIQIYLLAAKPSKITTALFRIQMNNLNGPFLAFLFPEVESRTLPFEQATYWIQHALLYIIPVYILKTGAYKMEDFYDFKWVAIGVMVMLSYHFAILNALSILTGINLSHMLCAAVSDPFQGQNYRIAATIHELLLCPILNKVTAFIFSDEVKRSQKISSELSEIKRNEPTTIYHQIKEVLRPQPFVETVVTQSTPNSKPIAILSSVPDENLHNILTHRLSTVGSGQAKVKNADSEKEALSENAANYALPIKKIY